MLLTNWFINADFSYNGTVNDLVGVISHQYKLRCVLDDFPTYSDGNLITVDELYIIVDTHKLTVNQELEIIYIVYLYALQDKILIHLKCHLLYT